MTGLIDRLRAINHRALILGLTLVAFGLRMLRLGFFSLRGDEAFDVVFAGQPLVDLAYQFRYVQPYPPLFHTLFHFWLPLAGDSETAIRFLAAGCTALVVPAIYVLGRQLFSARVGLVAALLIVVNPFAQWWGQDAHFYGYLLLSATLLTVVSLRLWRTLNRPDPPSGASAWRLAGLYVVVALISFLIHYFAYFTWGALNLVALVQTLRRHWSRKLVFTWWGTQIVLFLLYLPWIIWTLPLTTTFTQPWIDEISPGNILWRELKALNLGYTDHLGQAAQPAIPWLTGLAVLILVAGLGLGWLRRRNHQSTQIALGLFLAPLATMYLISLYRPLFDEKYAIALLPLYLVLLASAIVCIGQRWRWLGLVAGLAVAGTMTFSTVAYMTNLDNAKSPAWRELFEYVRSKAEPGDVLVYNFPEPTILFYNHDRLPARLVPGSGKIEPAEIYAQLEQAVAGYERVWLIPLVRSWWDRYGDVPTWLNRHADRLDQRFFRGVHVALYLTPAQWQATMTRQPVQLENGVDLLGFRVHSPAGDSPLFVQPGQTLALSLYWQAGGPTETPYTVFTHLLGPDGQVYGQWDNPPVAGTYPTTEWQPGEKVVDQYRIQVAGDAPPGEYRLVVGMYDPVSGARVATVPETGTAGTAEASDHILLDEELVIR